jgi:hypothetical protein
MTFRATVPLLAALLAAPLAAQEDTVTLTNGTVVTGVRVTSFDVNNLKYVKGSSNETVTTDQVAKVELKKFKDVYARGLRDPDLMITVARERLAEKDTLMAQFGFVGAANQWLDSGDPADAAKAIGALDELAKGIPEAGLLPEVFRLKFEFYVNQGAKGAPSAAAVAKKFSSDAVAGAWPNGLAVEAEFLTTLAERREPKEYQGKLRAVATKAAGTNPIVATRANVELAHSLREAKDVEGAQKIYEDVIAKDKVDESALAGAYLGLGKILLDKAAPSDKDAFKRALLLFLRVRLATKNAWPSLQAEALYHATLAAEKWRGPEFGLVIARCKRILSDEYGESEWAQRAKR